MAGKGWMSQIAAAAGIAAGTGAAQLGLGYGLGVVVWPTQAADDSVWLGSLGWATWIAASSTVLGAVIAERLGDRPVERPTSTTGGAVGAGPAEQPTGPLRFALVVAAAVGALLTVVLIGVPARAAVRPDTFAPELVAGGYAVIGVVLGLVIAYWAVGSRPAAANVVATASYLWALAAAGILVELTAGRDSVTYLTSWQFAELGDTPRYGTIYWPSSALTLLAALVLGMIAVVPAVRRGDMGVGAASSGAVGPVLVAAAFFVLAPQLTGALGQLQSAYLVAPYAVLFGLAGSALIVAGGQRAARRRQESRHRPTRPAATGKAAVPAAAAQPPQRKGALSPQRKESIEGANRTQAPAPQKKAGRTVAGPPAAPRIAKINPRPDASRG